jgi:TfoX/Sxy family transcriptional regulator of competence genes
MAYDERLAARVREILHSQRTIEEKKMMGGLTFMVNGKMCVGILKDDLMVRFDPDEYDRALTMKGFREMDFAGKPMRGFVFVGPEGTRLKRDLTKWVGMALAFNKKAKPSRRKKR